jgi:hypothetical protein
MPHFVRASTRDNENPVGIDEKHVFECDDLVEWLTQHQQSNLMTTKTVQGKVADILLLLIIVAGDDAHVDETWGKLMEAGDG